MAHSISSFLNEAIQIRRHLHQIPELKYEEEKTSDLIAKTLISYGYEVTRGVAKTGIVALLDSGKPGKTIAFRADIDALPLLEQTGLSYQSQHPGKMHACGHDGHTATLLLFARVLQQIKGELRGKIKLIFQPAEEGGKGSAAMIQAGVLEGVDAIFAYHNWPGLPLNMLATRSGCVLAGSGRFEMAIRGKKAHLAMPEQAINPVLIGSEIVKRIANLALPQTVINVLSFNSGDYREGISEQAEIVGCYFIEGEEALKELKQQIQRIVGASGSVVFHEFQSPTINTEKETELVFAMAKRVGIENVMQLPSCKMASEDFSEYLKHVPGCYFLMGAGETAPSVHTPHYDFPDAIMAPAAHLMLEVVQNDG